MPLYHPIRPKKRPGDTASFSVGSHDGDSIDAFLSRTLVELGKFTQNERKWFADEMFRRVASSNDSEIKALSLAILAVMPRDRGWRRTEIKAELANRGVIVGARDISVAVRQLINSRKLRFGARGSLIIPLDEIIGYSMSSRSADEHDALGTAVSLSERYSTRLADKSTVDCERPAENWDVDVTANKADPLDKMHPDVGSKLHERRSEAPIDAGSGEEMSLSDNLMQSDVERENIELRKLVAKMSQEQLQLLAILRRKI